MGNIFKKVTAGILAAVMTVTSLSLSAFAEKKADYTITGYKSIEVEYKGAMPGSATSYTWEEVGNDLVKIDEDTFGGGATITPNKKDNYSGTTTLKCTRKASNFNPFNWKNYENVYTCTVYVDMSGIYFKDGGSWISSETRTLVAKVVDEDGNPVKNAKIDMTVKSDGFLFISSKNDTFTAYTNDNGVANVIIEDSIYEEVLYYTVSAEGYDTVTTQVNKQIGLFHDSDKEATTVLTKKSYEVKFLNEDGSELSSTTYKHGDTLVIPAAPAKTADEKNSYTFDKWVDDNGNTPAATVTGSATYKATFTSSLNKYTITFKDYKGDILAEVTEDWGTALAPLVPAVPEYETVKEKFKFNVWDSTLPETITESKTFTATYVSYETKMYDYSIAYEVVDVNGVEISAAPVVAGLTGTAAYGTKISAPETAPAGYVFYGTTADIEVSEVVANNVLTVKIVPLFTVTFADKNGQISSNEYKSGEEVVVPTEFVKEYYIASEKTGYDRYFCEFTGWDKEVAEIVLADADYTAVYSKAPIVKFFLMDPQLGNATNGATAGMPNYKLIATVNDAYVLNADGEFEGTGLTLDTLGDTKKSWIEDTTNGLDKYLQNIPEISEKVIKAFNLPTLAAGEKYDIVWYVIKNEDDGFHVDGFINTYKVTTNYVLDGVNIGSTSANYVENSAYTTTGLADYENDNYSCTVENATGTVFTQPITVTYNYKTLTKDVYKLTDLNGEETDFFTSSVYTYDETPEAPATAPEFDEETAYFTGWTLDKESSTNFIRVFKGAIENKIAITWDFANGTDNLVEYYMPKTLINFPEDPTKPADNNNTYSFNAWVSEGYEGIIENGVTPAIEDITFVATYESTERNYTINYVNDGELLFTTNGAYTETAAYEGATPTRASVTSGNSVTSYYFNSWNRTVDGDTITFTATYASGTVTYNDVPAVVIPEGDTPLASTPEVIIPDESVALVEIPDDAATEDADLVIADDETALAGSPNTGVGIDGIVCGTALSLIVCAACVFGGKKKRSK